MTIHRNLAVFLLWGMPVCAFAETWTDVPLVDANCSAKVKANPDTHTRNCALQCAKSGYGILSADGAFLRFDGSGNDQALTALKSSDAKDHLRVTVTGDREGDTVKVTTLKMQ